MGSQSHDVVDMEVHLYCPELDQIYDDDDFFEDGDQEKNGKQLSPEGIKASALVRSLYNAGTPLHTKEAMRNVMEQLEGDAKEIHVQAFDGQSISFRRLTGEILDQGEGSEYDWLVGDPSIKFLSIQDLIEHVQRCSPPLSLCSMWIHYTLIKKVRNTGELCHLVPNQTVEEVDQFFQKHRAAWEASKQCQELRTILSDANKPRITKIIAFACGGLAFYDLIPWAGRIAYQHALILTIKDVIDAQQNHSSNIECYVQDPIYCELDRKVLKRNNITMLDSPKGFLEVDNSSIVLSFGPDIAIRQIVADITHPAIAIWDRDSFAIENIDVSSAADPGSPRLTKILNKCYTEVEFPHIDAFKKVAIFVRKCNNL